jgi:hypothetical protein
LYLRHLNHRHHRLYHLHHLPSLYHLRNLGLMFLFLQYLSIHLSQEVYLGQPHRRHIHQPHHCFLSSYHLDHHL